MGFSTKWHKPSESDIWFYTMITRRERRAGLHIALVAPSC